MAEGIPLLHTAFAIAAIVALITWSRVPPMLALLIGTVYLGLATGLGLDGTTKALTEGFGELMAEIGLLISLGVLLGSLLTATHALQRLSDAILRVIGSRGMPYATSLALSGLFSSIYSDVLLVLSTPLARRLAPRLGHRGIALMGGALTAGIEVGLVFVVPGVGALAVAGLLRVPLGTMFLFGLLVGLPTAVLTTLLYAFVLRRFLRWNPAIDEIEDSSPETVDEQDTPSEGRFPPLALCLAPVVVTLLLIALGAVAEAAGAGAGVIGFLGDPVVAMLVGATSAYAIARRFLPSSDVSAAVSSALHTAGPILVLSGVSGSLAKVISESGMDKTLSGYFSAGVLPPLVLVWIVAAVLHLALGSISVAAITAAGVVAPIAGNLGVPGVLIALAAGSGALFVPHVSSNFFWMFQTLLGLSTRGTFKTHSVAMTLSSLVSLPLILVLGLVM